MKVNQTQTAAQALDVLRQAEQSGREVTVGKHGEVKFASRLTTLVDSIQAKVKGSDWVATQQVERHQKVLDAFGTALSRDFNGLDSNKRMTKAWIGVVKDISFNFGSDYRTGVLPEAHALASAIASSLNQHLQKFDERQNKLAERAVSEFVHNQPPVDTQKLLDDVASGRFVGGGDARVELDAMRQALEERVERLLETYNNTAEPTDEQALQVKDHVVALANLTTAIKQAVETSRHAHDSRVPETDSGNGRGEFGTVRFAGANNPQNQEFAAAEGDDVRKVRAAKIEKGSTSLFVNGIEDRDSKKFAANQPLGEGAGVQSEQRRTAADVIAANRLWANYEDGGAVNDDGDPETRTVAQYANDEVSSKDVEAYRKRQAQKQQAEEATAQAKQAGAEPAAKPEKPVPADTWIVAAYNKDSPINLAIENSALKDHGSLAAQARNLYNNQLIKESDASLERRLIGYKPSEVNAIAAAIVGALLPKSVT